MITSNFKKNNVCRFKGLFEESPLTPLKHPKCCKEFFHLSSPSIKSNVIYLDFHWAKRALWLVDSWSRAPDRPGYNSVVVARVPKTTARDRCVNKLIESWCFFVSGNIGTLGKTKLFPSGPYIQCVLVTRRGGKHSGTCSLLPVSWILDFHQHAIFQSLEYPFDRDTFGVCFFDV